MERPTSVDAAELPTDHRSRAQGGARIALVLALSALGLWVLHPFLPALAWAVILAIALWPLYAKAERRWPPGGHNILLPSLFTLAVALVFLAPLVVLGVQAAREAHDAMAWAKSAERSGIPVPEFLSHLPYGAAKASAWWSETLSHPVRRVRDPAQARQLDYDRPDQEPGGSSRSPGCAIRLHPADVVLPVP